MRKSFIILTGLLLILLFTACKQFTADIDNYLGYWSAEAFVTDHSIASAHRADGASVQCVGSSADGVITLTAQNPKNLTLSKPAGIVEFKGLSDQPAAGTDYELKQTGSGTLELTYKSAFLKKYEQGSADLSPTITLKAQDGRVFKQAYTFSIKSNSPPPAPTVVLAKTNESTPHYVLCLKFDPAEMTRTVTAGSVTVPAHKDITSITINDTSYALLYKDDNSDFKKPTETNPIGSFIGSGEVAQLTTPPPLGAWVLYFKTGVAVNSINAQTSYTITLRDKEGVVSDSVTAELKEKFEVTFDAKGGSAVPPQYIEKDGKVIKPSPDPAKTGYVFDDWYTEDTFANKWDFANHTVTSNITLYAKWISGNTTPYHVAHYKQKVDSDDYALADTETKNDGVTDSIVNADSIKNDYEGFKYDHMLPNPPPAIAYDGTTRVKLYYNREQYDVSFSVVGNVGGSIAVTAATGASLPIGNPVKVKYYGSVTFTASPDTANNWEVEKWTVGGSVVPNHTSRTYTLSNIDGNKNVTVTFKKKFGVTFSVGYGQGGSLKGTYNGTTETTSGMQTIHVWEGGSVEFTALPDTANGWEVQSWMVDSAPVPSHTSETYTLSSVTQPKTVTVIFKKKTHTVTFSVVGGQGGSLTANCGSNPSTTASSTVQVTHGASVSFTATPATGWEVDGWTGATANTPNTTATLSNIRR